MVTYITVDSTKTGVGKYAHDLYKLMSPESQIIQLIFNQKYKDDFFKNPYRGFNTSLLNYAFSNFVFRSAINSINNRDDIIHITSQTIKPIFRNKNMVITIHDIIAFSKDQYIMEKIRRIGMRRYLRKYIKYKNIVTVSKQVKNEIVTKFNINENNVSVISPYVSDNFFPLNEKDNLRKELGLPLNKKLILSVSSDQPRKNLKMVKMVMDNLDNSYQLVRIGPQVGNSITFINLDGEKINKLYNACDMLLFPTLQEGFGYPVVEAFKTGLPVLSSNINVISEVSDGSAVLVNPEELNENLEGVYKVLENSDYYIKKGYERAKHYSSDVIRKKLVSYYSSIK